MTTLGQSCQFFNGKAHEKDINEDGTYVVVNSKFISTNGNVRKFTMKQMFPLIEDDIVMVMSDVPNGKALAKCFLIEENEKFSLNQRICAIRTSEFHIPFLLYQLNRHPYLLSFNNGENQTNLRKGDILNCPIWKPSLHEQKAIVKILDEAFAKIDQVKANIKKNIENAKELIDSYFLKIFEEKSSKIKFVEFGNVVNLSRGHNPPKSKFINEPKEGYLRFYQIRDGWSDDYKVYVPDNGKLHTVSPNEILMVAYRHIGRAFRGVSGAFNVALCKISNKDKLVLDDDYLFELIPSPYIRGELLKRSERSLIPSMSVKHLEKIKIPLPTLKVQKDIKSSILDIKKNCNTLMESYEVKLDNLEELKKSLLQKAFSGELTKSEAIA